MTARRRRKPERLFVSVPQAAEMLGIHRVTAYRMVKRDGALAGIPAVRVTDTKVVLSRAAILRLASDGHGK